ncbi:hypothetical protein Efla_005124 [Eimeria flavescens]
MRGTQLLRLLLVAVAFAGRPSHQLSATSGAKSRARALWWDWFNWFGGDDESDDTGGDDSTDTSDTSDISENSEPDEPDESNEPASEETKEEVVCQPGDCRPGFCAVEDEKIVCTCLGGYVSKDIDERHQQCVFADDEHFQFVLCVSLT